MVIILILIVLWSVVLGPGIIRRLRGRESHQSIDSFHHSLHLLERSGPKIVEPAYRLLGEGDGTVAVSPLPPARPRLVLLRPLGQGEEDPMYDHNDEFVDEGSGARYERVPYEIDEPESFGAAPLVEGYGRRMAAQRRRTILFSLVGGVVVTAIGGLVLPILWDVTILVFIALVAYVGLMAYAATHGMMSSTSIKPVDRLIAHGVAEGSYGDGEWYGDDDYASEWADEVDDAWYEEPRRAASR